MSLAAVVECATMIGFAVVVLGGKQMRVRGWKILVSLAMFVGVVQCCCMAIMVCFKFVLSPENLG